MHVTMFACMQIPPEILDPLLEEVNPNDLGEFYEIPPTMVRVHFPHQLDSQLGGAEAEDLPG